MFKDRKASLVIVGQAFSLVRLD